MTLVESLTSKQTKTLIDFHDALKKGQTTYLDPSNPQHNSLIKTSLNLSGRSENNYPNVYNALKTGGAYTGKHVDKIHLVDIGKTAKGKATATVWSSSDTPTMVNGGTTFLLDKDAGRIVAKGGNTAVRSGFLACSTRSATARQAGKKLDLLYLGHITGDDGKTRFVSYANSAPVGNTATTSEVSAEDETAIQATVTAPVTNKGNAEVEIAVGRTTANPPPSSTDYIYMETTGEGSNPYLISPFTGNVGLSGTIDIDALTASDVSTNIVVDYTNGTSCQANRAAEYTTDQDVVDAFSIGSAPNVLAWDFPFDGQGAGDNGYQTTKSIVYDKTTLTNEKASYFYFAFNSIPLEGGGVSAPFYVCSKSYPEEKSINCTEILNLLYWAHCLAKGTLITLEDGSKIPIEEINETFRVKTENGSLAVNATVLGEHNSMGSDGDKVYELTTKNGKSVIASEMHMIFMEGNQPRKIEDIVVGDNILTDEGVSTVIFNEVIEYDGMFYGLALGSLEEQESDDFPTNMASFYANGILTGDHETMRYHADEAYHDLDYMLPRINEEIHIDYTSALEDMRY